MERILDLEINWDGMSWIWIGFSIWKGFGMGFQGIGKDSRFGKSSGWDFNDLERVLDLERIWHGFLGFRKNLDLE